MNIRLIVALAVVPALAACQLRPRAYPDEAITTRGTPVTINVMANDSDPRAREIVLIDATDSAKGTTAVNADGTIRYTPNSDAVGEDVFSYRIKNSRGRTASAEVLVNIVEAELGKEAAAPGAAMPPTAPPPAATPPTATPPAATAPAAAPVAASTGNRPSAEPLPTPSASATINGVAVTLFTREDDKNEGETVQVTIRRGEEVVAERMLGPGAFPRQTDRIEELPLAAPVPGGEASKLTLEVRKVSGGGAGESWIMQVDVLGRLSDGRTVALLPKSLPFRFGGGSSNARSWTFQAVPAAGR